MTETTTTKKTSLPNQLRELLRRSGPGLITGAADDDPSGIVTYSSAGASFGYIMGWTVLLCLPFMVAVQEISARIGRVTGAGLAATLRDHTPGWFCGCMVATLVGANVINIGADVSAMGDVAHLMFGGPAAVWAVAVAAICAGCAIWISYVHYVRVMKFLTLPLLSYFVLLIVVKTDWHAAMIGTFIPHVPTNRGAWTMVVAVLGTTISPYLFFWQSDEEAEDEHLLADPRPLREHPKDAPAEMKRIGYDTWTGMIFSEAVAVAIMWGAAATLHAHGITNIQTATQAASALKPVAGPYAMFLFGFGVIGTGMLAVPVLAGSVAYAVGEARNWRVGLNCQANEARAFYGTLAASTFIGLLIALSPIDPVRALIGSAVLNGIAATPLIITITVFGMRKKVMGQLTLPKWLIAGGFASAILMGFATVAMFVL